MRAALIIILLIGAVTFFSCTGYVVFLATTENPVVFQQMESPLSREVKLTKAKINNGGFLTGKASTEVDMELEDFTDRELGEVFVEYSNLSILFSYLTENSVLLRYEVKTTAPEVVRTLNIKSFMIKEEESVLLIEYGKDVAFYITGAIILALIGTICIVGAGKLAEEV